MLISKHDCYKYLFDIKDKGIDVSEHISSLAVNGVPDSQTLKLITEHFNVPTIEFYKFLNNKKHNIIKETLSSQGAPVSTYIKIATSIITQATITLEKQFKDDLVGANKFMECLGLAKLSSALTEYFTTNNFTSLVETVNSVRTDIKLILD